VALLRYASAISWQKAASWVYLVFLVLVVLTATAGVLLTRRSVPRGTVTRGSRT
jgi:hypothetical protein